MAHWRRTSRLTVLPSTARMWTPWKFLRPNQRRCQPPRDLYEPLLVLPLEPRRVLDASFAAVAGDLLTLDNFTEVLAEDLTITEDAVNVQFVLSEGVWTGVDGAGVTGAGTGTLQLDRSTADALTTGVRINDSNGIALGIDFVDGDVNGVAVDLSAWVGDLEFANVGTLTQSSSVRIASLLAGASEVTLTDAANDFGRVSFGTTGNVSLTDQDALQLGASTVLGNLALRTSGDITQTDVLTVSGTTDVTLQGAGGSVLWGGQLNDLDGAVSLSGPIVDVELRNVSLAAAAPTLPTTVRHLTLSLDNVAASLPAIDVTGDLSITVGGDLTQSGTWQVQGTTTLQVTDSSRDVLLGTEANNLDGAVSVSGTLTNLALRNVNPKAQVAALPMVLGDLTWAHDATSLDIPAVQVGGDLTLAALDHITQSGVVNVSGDVTLTSTQGDISFTTTSLGLASPTLNASTGPGSIHFQDTGAADFDVASVTTGVGNVVLTFAQDATVHSIQAGGSAFGDGLVQVAARNLVVDAIDARNDQVTLIATGAISELGSDTAADIDTRSVIFNTVGDVGNVANPLELDASFLQADVAAGGLTLTNENHLRVIGSGVRVSGGDIALTAPSLRFNSAVLNQGGGDISVTATVGAVTIRNLLETSGGPSGEITVAAQGTIRVTSSGLVRTPTGSVGQHPTKFLVTAVPQSSGSAELLNDGGKASTAEATVDSSGFAQIFVWISDKSGTNFEISIDWTDLIERFPPQDNSGGAGNGSGPPFDGRVNHGFNHIYVANPDLSNPAAPIPVHLTAEFDYRPLGDNGIQFFGPGGVKVVLSASIDLIPPGEGIAWGITFPEALVPPAAMPPKVHVPVAETVSSTTSATDEVIESATRSKANITFERQLVLRVVSSSGEEGEDIVLDVEDLNDLPGLFGRLPDNRYRIYLTQEDGSTRLVLDVAVRQGKVTDPSDLGEERAERPVVVPDEELRTQPVSQEPTGAKTGPDGTDPATLHVESSLLGGAGGLLLLAQTPGTPVVRCAREAALIRFGRKHAIRPHRRRHKTLM